MKKYPVSVQLYSLREEVKQSGYVEIFKKVAEFGYVAVELGDLYGKKPAEIKKALDDLGLKVSSNHGAVPKSDNIAQIVDTAKELGYHWHVTGFSRDSFADEEACLKTAEIMQAGAIALKKHGVKLAMHNHAWEFNKKINGRYPHQIVMDAAPDLHAQIDTYWAAAGGANVPEVIKKISSRVPLLHIKDGPMNKEQPMTAVGEGKMDFLPIIESADENILEWLIVEIDRCAGDMCEAVRKSLRYLADNRFGLARE